MNRVPNQRTSVSTLLGAAIFDAEGGEFGRVREFAVAPLIDASRVEGFVVRAAGTENRIAVARQRYNASLKDYNVYVQQFPNSIWAGMAGFHYRDEYFKGNPANGTAPTVDFGK